MILDMEAKKKLSPKKLTISLLSISQSYFKLPKTIRGNATHYFIMKKRNKKNFQQIATNHFSDVDLKDFMKLYKGSIKRTYSVLVNDKTLPSYNLVRLKKNVL